MFLLVFVYSFAFFCGLVWFGACTKIPQSIVLKYIIHRACDRHPFFEKSLKFHRQAQGWVTLPLPDVTTPPEIRLNHALWRETNPFKKPLIRRPYFWGPRYVKGENWFIKPPTSPTLLTFPTTTKSVFSSCEGTGVDWDQLAV